MWAKIDQVHPYCRITFRLDKFGFANHGAELRFVGRSKFDKNTIVLYGQFPAKEI